MRIALVLLVVALTGCAAPHKPATDSTPKHGTSVLPVQGDRYYFDQCAVCKNLLGTQGDVIDANVDGQHVRFCRQKCADEFAANKSERLAALNQKMIDDQLPWYPLKVSVVSDVPLAEKPVDFVWGNRLIRVNDESEKSRFLAGPQPCFDRLTQVTLDLRCPNYPVDKCPVQGRPIIEPEGGLNAVVIGYRVVRVCCPGCANLVREHPNHYLPIIDLAYRMKNESKLTK